MSFSRNTNKPFPLKIWLLRHAQVALSSLGHLSRASIATLMTTLVIGIAVSLPAGMWVLLSNVQQLSGSLDGAASISVFLKADASDEAIERLRKKLSVSPQIKQVTFISRDQAMDEFKHFSGFGKALDVLDENPLPAVLIITPTDEYGSTEQAKNLLNQLNQEPLSDFAQLDLEWIKRFHAMTEIGRRAVIVLASLLSLAVLLIIGNTIRLEIQNRHAEIEITRLVGATNAFIRRPFLYTGFWYGLIGGLFAWLLVSLSLWLLAAPIETLTGLYHSEFNLNQLGLKTTILLLIGTALIGLAGARIAVGRHLSAIEPE